MNERIDRLIDQCTVQGFSDCVGGYETFDKEKFAELIVLECVGVCEEYRGTEWGKAAECIGEQIKQHFGIEE
jgi:hypothetical protein